MALIARVRFPRATALVAVMMLPAMWLLAGRYLGREPAEMGLLPDGGAAGAGAGIRGGEPWAAAPLPGMAWRDRRFATLAVAATLGLFAQIGLAAQLFSLLLPALGNGVLA